MDEDAVSPVIGVILAAMTGQLVFGIGGNTGNIRFCFDAVMRLVFTSL